MISLFSYLSGYSNGPLTLDLSGGTQVSSNKVDKNDKQGKCHDEGRGDNGGGCRRSRYRSSSGAAALSRSPDFGGTAASPAPRRHQGRVRPPRPRRHQFGAGAAAVQYRRQG